MQCERDLVAWAHAQSGRLAALFIEVAIANETTGVSQPAIREVYSQYAFFAADVGWLRDRSADRSSGAYFLGSSECQQSRKENGQN